MSELTERWAANGAIPALQRATLSERVALTLKRLILIDRFQPGDRLPPERQLAEQLTVSRTVLREAISMLVGEGILARASPRVLAIADFDRAKVAAALGPLDRADAETQELIELRVILEFGAVDLIVQRATDDDLKEIERWVVEGERRAATGEPIHFADAHFHAALLKVVGNSVISGLLPVVEEHFRHELAIKPDLLSQIGAPGHASVETQHREIFEAIQRRDAEAMRRVLHEHLDPYLQRNR